jgi:phospholipid/cholesterol/gamma-HCH transport system substrate-binding protein
MSTRSSARDVWVGLIVIVAVAGLIALVSMASDGPGFLAPHRTVDVVFRDAQGIRIGSPVRVAGLDTGNVVDVDLVEDEERILRARIRISLPARLVKKLRQDMKVSIQPALTGMSHVNVLSTGRSAVAWVPGQPPIRGVETSFFDPIIEQVGLGPVERNHLSHTIAQVRQTVDSIGPRLQQMLGSLQETTTNLKDMSDAVRPAVESTVGQVEDMTRRLSANSPRFEKIIVQTEGVTKELEGYLVDNRENVRQTVASVRDFTSTINPILARDVPRIEHMLDGLEGSRARADRVLYQADQIAGQVSGLMARNRAEIERSVTNVRDATDWANRLVQKIFTNPIVLTPFYKPSHEDLRVQVAFDTALVFTKGAQEVHDAVKTLETMAARPATQQQQQDILQLEQNVRMLSGQLSETSARLAEALKRPGSSGRDRAIR